MALKYNSHPGSGYMKVVCDVCGGEFLRKDVALVKDKYNFQNGLVVCFADLDSINEQVLPNRHTEAPVPSPELIRPVHDLEYATNDNDDRVPSAPRNGIAYPSTIDSTIFISWDGPFDTGSSDITGYLITRADPQASYQATIEANTGSSATFYEDTTGLVATDYTYTVAAINSYGTGAASPLIYYPTVLVDTSVNYLVLSQDSSVLTTGDGTYIIL